MTMTPEEHVDMMRNPVRWPNRILPVKNIRRYDKGGFALLGYMINVDGNTVPMVLLGNIFFPPTTNKFLEAEEYNSLEAVVAAGWRVD